MGDIKKQIIDLLNETPTLPVLFVGSGLSRRYLNLPDWEGLLKHFAEYLSKPYSYYYNEAKNDDSLKDESLLLPRVADFIEKEFNKVWFENEEFESQREKYKDEIDAKISPFKIAMADYFNTKSGKTTSSYSKEIESLKEITEKNISCIITTNYDLFFEKILGDSFQKYVGQSELMFSKTIELAELYKIHGCCTKPESLVIDKNDYQEFMDKQKYLSAKLLTIFLEHPIIFIGYSLTDTNIRKILESITDCLEDEQLRQLKNRLIFIEWNNTDGADEIKERVFSFDNQKSITMQSFCIKDYAILYNAIHSIHAKYEVRTLRRIKQQLYELVATNKPTEKLFVATELDNDNPDIEFVVGIGVYGKFGDTGYSGLNRNQLYRYVLGLGNTNLKSDLILKKTIPDLYNGSSKLPVCRMVSQCNDKDNISDRAKKSLVKSIDDFRTEENRKKIKRDGYRHLDVSLMYYYENHKLSQVLSLVPLLDPNEIVVDDLYQVLVRAIDDDITLLDEEKKVDNPNNSALRKCISIWDWLKYHKAAEKRLKELGI